MDFDDDGPGRQRDALNGLMLAAAVAALATLAGGVWWVASRPAKPSPPTTSTAPTPAARPPADRVAPATEPEAAPPPSPGRRRERAPRAADVPAPEPAPVPVPAGPVLVVESDVAGASVFFNRKYLGTTPLRSTEVTPGAGQINASAEGYDGIVQAVEVAESGPTQVTLRFKEVRLDASVAVVHRHGMGSCEGTLRATPAGLRYDTSNRNDAFTLGFDDLEVFEVDYLQKNLKVKQRGGRTWNFSTKAANADPLFVFHRDVEKARAKLR